MRLKGKRLRIVLDCAAKDNSYAVLSECLSAARLSAVGVGTYSKHRVKARRGTAKQRIMAVVSDTDSTTISATTHDVVERNVVIHPDGRIEITERRAA